MMTRDENYGSLRNKPQMKKRGNESMETKSKKEELGWFKRMRAVAGG